MSLTRRAAARPRRASRRPGSAQAARSPRSGSACSTRRRRSTARSSPSRDARPSPSCVRRATTATSRACCSTGCVSSSRTSAAARCSSSRTSSSTRPAPRSTPTRGSSSPPRTRLRRMGAASVVVAEGPGHRRDTEAVMLASGMQRGARRRAASRSSTSTTPRSSGRRCAPRTRGCASSGSRASSGRRSVVVSMPKLKTHHWVGVTMSLKNCFGCMPGRVYGWPKDVFHVRGIPESILDIVAAVRPSLVIMDGIVGMEGDGPIMGDPVAVRRRRRRARPRGGGRHRCATDGDGSREGAVPDGGGALPRSGAVGAHRAARRGSRAARAKKFRPAPSFENLAGLTAPERGSVERLRPALAAASREPAAEQTRGARRAYTCCRRSVA